MEFRGDHFSCFVVWFVDTFSFFFIEDDTKKNKKGRKDYDDLEMMKLIFYAFSEEITSPRMIVKFAKYIIKFINMLVIE